ncbi:transposase, partial [Polynucleobacter sp. MWH-Berg-3C6]|nr:transposase [Polynucleobacter sp. MWH-Berg-3C6]
AEVIRMASTYGRYGYRFIAGMMRNAGWGQATTAKVARIWRQEVNCCQFRSITKESFFIVNHCSNMG